MRLVPDAGTAEWIGTLTGSPEEFDWDAGNRSKLTKHSVTSAEVESLVGSDLAFGGRIVEPKHAERRWLLLGRSATGRHLALIFTRRGDRLRPVSCRAMRKNEKRFHEEVMHDSKAAQG